MKKDTSKDNTLNPKEYYLKIPYSLLNIPNIGLSEKVLLAHFYSFGEKGCWQSNATLAKMFMVSPRTIKRWIANIQKTGKIHTKCPKGYYRTIWVKSHPDVISAGQNRHITKDKNGTVSRPKPVFRPGQNCPTTNNNTNKDTIKDTTATPSPLPAGGRAPALLAARCEQQKVEVSKFDHIFGRPDKACKPLSEGEFEQKRQKMLKELKG